MPPSVVLEVLRILRAEIDLRDLTRATQQKRDAILPHQYQKDSQELADTQEGLRERTQVVVEALEEMAAAEKKNFARPIQQLTAAMNAMGGAATILETPDTGSPAIAAENEAIEHLLTTKKAGKSGGGGGGSTPGGGTGGGETDALASALAGLGDGVEAKPRFVEQATGSADSGHPEEFKAGLDAYFDSLEKGP